MSRERSSLEQFEVLPLGDSGPMLSNTVPLPVTSLLPSPAEEGDDEPTGVLGTLKEMPVSEIVQTLAQGNKDAIVEVKPKGEPVGIIGIEHGRVVFATCDGVDGERAFQRLFCAHRGAFRIRYGRKSETHNITRDLTWLLLEAARVLDERQRTSPVFDTPPEGMPFLDALHEPPPTPPPVMPVTSMTAATAATAKPFAPRPVSVVTKNEAKNEARNEAKPPPLPASTSSKPRKREPLPRTITPFGRFFDEAGVKTPPPIPLGDAQRFQSLSVAEQLDDVDDIDRVDTDRTTPQRRSGRNVISG